VLLNINGATDSLSNFQITLNGTDDTHVLYNFYQATALTDSSVSIEGSVLAPNAAVSGSGAHINGTLVANSFSGGLEQHEFLFQGNLPASTPEPGTWVTFIAGLGLVWFRGAGFSLQGRDSSRPGQSGCGMRTDAPVRQARCR
jgi:hypothetical protein